MDIEVVATLAENAGLHFFRRQLNNFHAVQLTHNEIVTFAQAVERHTRAAMQKQIYDLIDRHEEEVKQLRAENKQ